MDIKALVIVTIIEVGAMVVVSIMAGIIVVGIVGGMNTTVGVIDSVKA
jgi:hypothetical protein